MNGTVGSVVLGVLWALSVQAQTGIDAQENLFGATSMMVIVDEAGWVVVADRRGVEEQAIRYFPVPLSPIISNTK